MDLSEGPALSPGVSLGLFLCVTRTTELLYIFIAIAKGIAVWFVPFAVVAYVVTYFVMAIIFVIVWSRSKTRGYIHFGRR
jgi:hypothetical protein